MSKILGTAKSQRYAWQCFRKKKNPWYISIENCSSERFKPDFWLKGVSRYLIQDQITLIKDSNGRISGKSQLNMVDPIKIDWNQQKIWANKIWLISLYKT